MSSSVQALQLALLDPAATDGAAWQVRSSFRARRLTVKVFPGGRVEIVVPDGTRPRAVERFVGRNREWIERKVEQFRPLHGVLDDGIPPRISFQASGESWPVTVAEISDPTSVSLVGGGLLLRGRRQDVGGALEALQRWLLAEAQRVLAPRLEQVAGQTGLRYARLQVRRQRTRWGSCSRRGTISLNACLVFQPAAVVRYLLVHELAHTRHLNHSADFWSLVAELEPDWRRLDGELAHGWRNVPGWALR